MRCVSPLQGLLCVLYRPRCPMVACSSIGSSARTMHAAFASCRCRDETIGWKCDWPTKRAARCSGSVLGARRADNCRARRASAAQSSECMKAVLPMSVKPVQSNWRALPPAQSPRHVRSHASMTCSNASWRSKIASLLCVGRKQLASKNRARQTIGETRNGCLLTMQRMQQELARVFEALT